MANITSTAWFDALEISVGGIFPFHRQIRSQTGGGTALVRNYGTQLWTAEFTTVPMLLQTAYDVESDLLDLDGGVGWVALFDPRRDKPAAYSGTGSLGGYSYTSIDSDDLHIVNLNIGGTALSKGDYFSYTNNGSQYLHRIVKMINQTQARIYPAMSLNAPASHDIVVDKAFARFQIQPTQVNNRLISVDGFTKHGTISFMGVQTII